MWHAHYNNIILTRSRVPKFTIIISRNSSILYREQTLTTIKFQSNSIGAKGARAIAQALERNQVR